MKRKGRRKQTALSPEQELARAEHEAARNKARIEAGVTFASRKASTWKRAGGRMS